VPAELVREATRDGKRVVLLRCYDGADGQTVVEAEVTPLGTETALGRGPYHFASAADGFRFVQEAVLALQYLGCSVA
jgi:hypothetical protein